LRVPGAVFGELVEVVGVAFVEHGYLPGEWDGGIIPPALVGAGG
jgi:hypothetical protein